MLFNFEEKWLEINSVSRITNKGIAVLVEKGTVCKVYIYSNYNEKKRSVIVGLKESIFQNKIKLPEISGVVCKKLYKYASISGELLVIEQNSSIHTSISEAFMSEICRILIALKKEDEVLISLLNTFQSWKSYFDINKDDFTREKQLGLYGEMFFLNNVLIKQLGIRKAIDSWKGYDAERHDFEIPDISFEIKATESKKPLKITISNEKQLETGKLKYLYLIVYNVVSSEGTTGDLPILINSLIEKINDIEDNLLKIRFKKYLMKIGYDFNSEFNYIRKYTIINLDEEVYMVSKEFPRLITSDLKKIKDSDAILDIKYSLNMDSCKKFIIKKILFS